MATADGNDLSYNLNSSGGRHLSVMRKHGLQHITARRTNAESRTRRNEDATSLTDKVSDGGAWVEHDPHSPM